MSAGMMQIKQNGIHSLYRNNPTARETQQGTRFEVDGLAGGSTQFTLTLFLERDFPARAPTMRVRPALNHAILSTEMWVTASLALNRWHMHADLGQVVKAVMDELAAAQPARPSWGGGGSSSGTGVAAAGGFSQPAGSWGGVHTTAATVGATGYSAGSGGGGNGNGGGSAMELLGLPAVPAHFTQLDSLSSEELNELNDNPEKFSEFFAKLPQTQQLKEVEAKLYRENRELAEANLARKPELEKAQRELTEQHAALAEQKGRYEALAAKHAELSSQLSVESIETQLQIAEAEAKDAAAAIADQFNKGTLSVDDFLVQFKEAQTTFHMRKNKREAYRATKEAGLG